MWSQSAWLGSKDRNIFIQNLISLLPSEAKMTHIFVQVACDILASKLDSRSTQANLRKCVYQLENLQTTHPFHKISFLHPQENSQSVYTPLHTAEIIKFIA